eukprot:TRINITY_DN2879_c0_g1_i1.p1 TRINITY_DN2879_c0_g1~~TRINITY_DN2879_c0_g1_i1.p1  ORF type:complete len:204 (-),score=53.39 TRINITY_DN2879_c0_g1_i1:19-630(-)
MEVEVKLRLPSREAHDQVAKVLEGQSGPPFKIYMQENVFFDGTNSELSNERAALRLRFFEDDGARKCVVTVKESSVIEGGIGRAKETEEDIDAQEGERIRKDPNAIMNTSHNLLTTIRERYHCRGFHSLGGFENTRHVFKWHDHKLELDETRYYFGTTWEIEVETAQPEEMRDELQKLLDTNAIPHQHSKKSKFANFLAKKID